MASKHTPYFNFLDALRAPGCALCGTAQKTVERYLQGILYESVVDPTTQTTMILAHGLCPAHSEQLLRQRDTLGVAILYNAILGHLLEELPDDGSTGGDWRGRLAVRLGRRAETDPSLAAHRPCPACARRDEAVSRALGLLKAHHADPELQDALASASPLCLPHLRSALESIDPAALRPLLAHQRAAWQRLRSELSELIRKNDHHFRHESIGAEGDSWQRAVRATVGEPGVF